MKEITLYYAVSARGQGLVFTNLPRRNEYYQVWLGSINGTFSNLVMMMEANGFRLPVLRWTDEPVALRLKLELRDEKQV